MSHVDVWEKVFQGDEISPQGRRVSDMFEDQQRIQGCFMIKHRRQPEKIKLCGEESAG